MPSAMRRRWIYLLVLVLLVGCGTDRGAAPVMTIVAAARPADWQPIALAQITLALPPEWSATEAADNAFDTSIEEAAAQNPQLQALLERGQADLASGVVELIAYDLDPGNLGAAAYPTNLRIGRQSYPEPPALAKVSDVNERDLRANGSFRDVDRAPVIVCGHDATRLRSRLQINDSTGNQLDLALEQYLLVESNAVYIVSFTMPADEQPNYRSTLDRILATLQLKPAQ